MVICIQVSHDFSVFAALSVSPVGGGGGEGSGLPSVQTFLMDPKIADFSICSVFFLLGQSGSV